MKNGAFLKVQDKSKIIMKVRWLWEPSGCSLQEESGEQTCTDNWIYLPLISFSTDVANEVSSKNALQLNVGVCLVKYS